jgi:hypothetical protein
MLDHCEDIWQTMFLLPNGETLLLPDVEEAVDEVPDTIEDIQSTSSASSSSSSSSSSTSSEGSSDISGGGDFTLEFTTSCGHTIKVKAVLKKGGK